MILASPELIVRSPDGDVLFRRPWSLLELANAEHGMAKPTADMKLHVGCAKFAAARSTLRFPNGLYWCHRCGEAWDPEAAATPAPAPVDRIQKAIAALAAARTRDHYIHVFGILLPAPIGTTCPVHRTFPLVIKDSDAWCRAGRHWPLKEVIE